MGILQNYNEGNMDALRSVKYSETGTQAPYVVKDIKDPPQNNDKTIGLEFNKRIDDTSRIAQMLIDKPGLKFVGNQTLLSASEIARKAKAAAAKKRDDGGTVAGAVLAGAAAGAAAAGQVLKVVGSTLAQVPVNGTGTHFVRGFTPDTYLKQGDPNGILGFLGADGESGAAKALQGTKIIPDGNPQEGLESFPIEDAYRVSKKIDSTTGALGLGDISSNTYSERDNTLDEFAPQDSDYLDSNYSAQERQFYAKNGQTIIPDNVSPDYIPPISSNLKVSGSSTPFGNIETELSSSRVDTPTAPLAQTGNVITIQGATETTATSGGLGISSNVPESLKTVTGYTGSITPFEVDPEKAKGNYTDQQNTQNAISGQAVNLKESSRETTPTSGSFGTSNNVSASAETATGLQEIEASVFSVDQDEAKGRNITQDNTLSALTGSAIPLKGDTRETTPATNTFGISNTVSASAETVTGFQEIEASVFSVDKDKAKGKSTTQENTLFALTGSAIPLQGDIRQTTESPGQGLVGGRSNSGITGDIIGPGSREENRYSSGSTFTDRDTADNIRSMQKGEISFNDGNIPLRDNAYLDTVSETALSQNITGDYDGTTKSVGRGVPGDIQDFRNPDSDNNYNGRVSNSYPLNYASPTINKETRVGLGNQGKKKNLTNYSITDPASIDKLNYLDVKTVSNGENGRIDSNVHTPDERESSRDFIKFNFQIITPEDTTFLYFRAFLTQFSDGYQGSWDTSKYLGRAENFYTYQGFDRSISIGFNIAAATRKEMKPLYRKMAALASVTAPTYGADGKFMRGTIVKVTVGDYIYELPGIIESVDYTWNTDYNWEIAFQNQEGNVDDDMQELPQIMDCSLKFKPIHNFVPEAVGKGRLLPYITNPIPNGSDKAIFIPQP